MRHTISPNSDRLRTRVMKAYGAVGILIIKKSSYPDSSQHHCVGSFVLSFMMLKQRETTGVSVIESSKMRFLLSPKERT